MRKCKTKAIQADLGIFMYLQTYSRIFRHIQAYSNIYINELFRYIPNPVTPWHIQNSDIFIIMTYSKPEAYSELWYIQ